MSTFYYAVCDKHRVHSWVLGGRSFPDRWWSNDEGELEDFLREHGDCKPAPQIVSEHDERTDDYAEQSRAVLDARSAGISENHRLRPRAGIGGNPHEQVTTPLPCPRSRPRRLRP